VDDAVTGRPQWSVLEGMLSDLKQTFAKVPDLQRRMLRVTGEAWSDDRTVKAVVGPKGHLLELEIDPRVYRKPNSKELAATIVATVRRAIEDATSKTREIAEEAMPADPMLRDIGGLGRFAFGHDADTRLKGDDPDGQ
jgi:DNA-binding protein YbaB